MQAERQTITDSMRHSSKHPLFRDGQIPFGTQYYRAPSPRPEEWEQDLAAIARLGMNTVKFWIQWRWNNPARGVFRFDDIDRLMEIAERNRLKVVLNTIVDVAPAWIFRDFPDASMVTLHGWKVGPQVQPHRQIGGLGVCLNHPEVMQLLFEFLRASIRRYKDHPALEIWNVASEPEITQSMAELRLWADDFTQMGDMLCYCSNCQKAFPGWLRKKYGSIEALNISWNRNYAGFDEVEIPRTRNSFNDVIDWRMFFVDTLAEHVRRRFAIAREEDSQHPLMCHHVFIQGFPVTSTGNDPWNFGQLGDLHGITQMDDAMMCDVLRSAAHGKPVISAEMLVLFGYTLDLSPLPTADDIKRHIFTGIAANLKGFLFWQYRPETLAREAPAWGLTQLDGSITPWLQAFADCGAVLQRNAAFLLDATPRPADVALLYAPENQIFGWTATGNEKTVTDSLLGMHRAFYEANFTVDVLHERQLPDLLPRHRVLVLPFPYRLSQASCRLIGDWVEAGGTILAEAYCAGWNAEEGRHSTTIPGHGLDRIFQASQPAASRGDEQGIVDIHVGEGFQDGGQDLVVKGALVKASLAPKGAEVLARFNDGSVAVTRARTGKGTAILVGSYLALPLFRGTAPQNGRFLASLVEQTGNLSPRPIARGDARIRLDLLTGTTGNVLLIARNLDARVVAADIDLPVNSPVRLKEQFSGEEIFCSPTDRGLGCRIAFGPLEVKVYHG